MCSHLNFLSLGIRIYLGTIHVFSNQEKYWHIIDVGLVKKPLTNLCGSYSSFFVLKTDAHYSILLLLLCLSDSPSNSNYVETPRDKQVGMLPNVLIHNT